MGFFRISGTRTLQLGSGNSSRPVFEDAFGCLCDLCIRDNLCILGDTHWFCKFEQLRENACKCLVLRLTQLLKCVPSSVGLHPRRHDRHTLCSIFCLWDFNNLFCSSQFVSEHTYLHFQL